MAGLIYKPALEASIDVLFHTPDWAIPAWFLATLATYKGYQRQVILFCHWQNEAQWREFYVDETDQHRLTVATRLRINLLQIVRNAASQTTVTSPHSRKPFLDASFANARESPSNVVDWRHYQTYRPIFYRLANKNFDEVVKTTFANLPKLMKVTNFVLANLEYTTLPSYIIKEIPPPCP